MIESPHMSDEEYQRLLDDEEYKTFVCVLSPKPENMTQDDWENYISRETWEERKRR